MSGGPYGPGGVLSDFEGGEGGGGPKGYNRRDPKTGNRNDNDRKTTKVPIIKKRCRWKTPTLRRCLHLLIKTETANSPTQSLR